LSYGSQALCSVWYVGRAQSVDHDRSPCWLPTACVTALTISALSLDTALGNDVISLPLALQRGGGRSGSASPLRPEVDDEANYGVCISSTLPAGDPCGSG
jgi:hypothetical protein